MSAWFNNMSFSIRRAALPASNGGFSLINRSSNSVCTSSCTTARKATRAAASKGTKAGEDPEKRWRSFVEDGTVKASVAGSHFPTAFGHVRLDSDNSPAYHGQLDPNSDDHDDDDGGVESKTTVPGSSGSSSLSSQFGPANYAVYRGGDSWCLESDDEAVGGQRPFYKVLNVGGRDERSDPEEARVQPGPEKGRRSSFFHYSLAEFSERNLDAGQEDRPVVPSTELQLGEIDSQFFSSLSDLEDKDYYDSGVALPADQPPYPAASEGLVELHQVPDSTSLNEVDRQMFGEHPATCLKRLEQGLNKPKEGTFDWRKRDKPIRPDKQIIGSSKAELDKGSKSKPGAKSALFYVKQMRRQASLTRCQVGAAADPSAPAAVAAAPSKELQVRMIGVSMQARMAGAAAQLALEQGILTQPTVSSSRRPLLNGAEDKEEIGSLVGNGRVDPAFLPQDLEGLTSAEVKNLLCSSVIYNDHDIVAISKPSGLQMFGAAPQQDKLLQQKAKGHRREDRHSVEKYLPALAETVGADQLYQVHRLDKCTSGLLLLAKSLDMHNALTNMLRLRAITKTYWAIVNGSPNPAQGTIRIPIAEAVISSKRRQTVVPDYAQSALTSGKRVAICNRSNLMPAVTEYSTLASRGNASLLLVQPVTGFKHQIRVHLGLGLSTPVLGDHKYSSVGDLGKPQRVHGDILERMGVRRSKARDLPVYLHSKKILIPNVLPDGGIISIDSRLPHHFVKAMKRLKLAPQKSVTK